MKRLSIATAAAALLNAMGGFGMARGGVHRTSADSKRGRQMVSKGYRCRSKYVPHQGAKERERAKRCYLSHYLNQQFVDDMRARGFLLAPDQCHERSTPTICQRWRS